MSVASRLRSWLDAHPAAKRTLKTIVAPVRGGSSRGYRRIGAGDVTAMSERLRGAWQSPAIPARQRALVDRSLARYRSGEPNPAFDALVRELRPLVESVGRGRRATLLEVGCSSGYHAEVLALKGLNVQYHGTDYSPAFIGMARRLYAAYRFFVGDATRLPIRPGSYDIVLSGCCLLHIPSYEAAIRETARVARRYAVFHRTPVLHRSETTYYRKLAYGVETVEIHFNEEELVALLAKHGLRVIGVSTLAVAWTSGDAFATKEYVCEKVPDA